VFVTNTPGGQAPLTLATTNPIEPTLASAGLLRQPEVLAPELPSQSLSSAQLVSMALFESTASPSLMPTASSAIFSPEWDSEANPDPATIVAQDQLRGIAPAALDSFFSNLADELATTSTPQTEKSNELLGTIGLAPPLDSPV
jgi:hypothetical protein